MNNKLKFLSTFLFFTLLSVYASGQMILQSSADIVSNNFVSIETNSSQNILSDVMDEENVEIVKPFTLVSIDESEFTYKVSKSFGSYIIPNTNYLKIVASDGKVYTQAELIHSESKVRLFLLPLDEEMNVVDMTHAQLGKHTLILTNSNGDKYVEDILIM
jgi:hypothetical protein